MPDDCCFVEPIEVVVVAEPLDVVVVAEPVEAEITICSDTTITVTAPGTVAAPDHVREEFVVALAGAATIFLARVPSSVTGVYVNGLLLVSASYSVVGASVLISGSVDLVASDQIAITYY